jgi:hypothetical protein
MKVLGLSKNIRTNLVTTEYEVVVRLRVNENIAQGDEQDLFVERIQNAFEPGLTSNDWGLPGTQVIVGSVKKLS